MLTNRTSGIGATSPASSARPALGRVVRSLTSLSMALTTTGIACKSSFELPEKAGQPLAASDAALTNQNNQTYDSLPALPGSPALGGGTLGYGINHRRGAAVGRVIVGTSTGGAACGGRWSATRWLPVTFAPVAFSVSELLTGLPAGTCDISVALDVNDKDQTVGWYKEVTGATRAFFHSNATGALTLPNRGGNQAAAYAISNLGVIVGFDSTAGAKHAVTWTKSGGVYIVTDVHPAGYVSSEANDVNDSGMITGRVCVTASNCRVARWPTAAAAPWVSGIVPGSDVDVMWPIPVRAISVDTAGVITGVRKVGAAQMSFFVLPTTTLAVSIAANPVITSEASPRGRTIGLTVTGATSLVYMRYGGVAMAMSAAASSWGTGVNKCGDVIWNEFTGAVYFSRYSYRSVCDP